MRIGAMPTLAVLTGALSLAACASTAPPPQAAAAPPVELVTARHEAGQGALRGVAAMYHPTRFTGRRMANGVPFNPNANHAAHRTLPFGTVARVTNLRNGASTTVVISDRGPFTPGRILDLSPRSAREIGMEGGIAPVEIRPIGREARM